MAPIQLSFFLIYQDNFYYIAVALILSKLYSNSFLVLLNNRTTLRASQPNIHFDETQLSSTHGPTRIMDRSAIQVNIDRQTYSENLAMISLTKVNILTSFKIFYSSERAFSHIQQGIPSSGVRKKGSSSSLNFNESESV